MAKQRMASLLTQQERENLSWAMFHDVVETVRRVKTPVAIVTGSDTAAEMARERGWKVFYEEGQISESDSVDQASIQLARLGTDTVLRLPADLPLIQTTDIEQILNAAPKCAALLVPSRDLLGTNAVLRSPPDLFPSRFGHNSFALHMREALQIGASLRIHQNSRIACDLDQPSDIAWLLENPSPTRTLGFLESINIRQRISQNAVR